MRFDRLITTSEFKNLSFGLRKLISHLIMVTLPCRVFVYTVSSTGSAKDYGFYAVLRQKFTKSRHAWNTVPDMLCSLGTCWAWSLLTVGNVSRTSTMTPCWAGGAAAHFPPCRALVRYADYLERTPGDLLWPFELCFVSESGLRAAWLCQWLRCNLRL